MGASYTYPMDDKWASLGFPARVCGLLGIRIDGAASLLMVPVFSCYPGTYDAYSTVDSSRCCSLRCRATSRSTVRWQLPVSLAFLPSTPRMLCRLSSAWRTSILLVIALALQLQTILGEQLASDDQAADVVDIGTVISLGDGIARVYGCEA